MSAESSPRASRSLRGYRRTIALVVAVLLLACLAFVALAVLQGPRVTGVDLSVGNLVSQSQQRVIFRLNQPLNESVDTELEVTPAADARVEVSGQTVTVTFAERLDYDTEYSLVVSGAQGSFTGRAAEVATSFTTPEAELLALVRGGARGDPAKTEDRIVRLGFSENVSSDVFQDPAIQEFAIVGAYIAVVTVDADGGSQLFIVDEASRSVEQILLPAAGRITGLESGPGLLIGFVFTAFDESIAQQLLLLDLATGRSLVPLAGLGGAPVSVVEWSFLAGSSRVLVHDTETNLLLLDARNTELQVPLGQVAALYDVSLDGSTAVVGGLDGRELLHLEDASREPLPAPTLEGAQLFEGETLLVDDGVLQRVVSFRDGEYGAALWARDAAGEWSVLYEPGPGITLTRAYLSPNGQYVALETSPRGSGSGLDGYPANAKPVETTTIILDIDTRAVVKTLLGVDVDWRLGGV